MLVNRISVSIASLMLLGACGNSGDFQAEKQPPINGSNPTIAPIASGEMVIKFQIGEQEPRDWTITPELSPDSLVFECPEGEIIPVTFETDVETRTIPMTIEQDSLQFDIIVNKDIVALTELKCIEEIVRYKGDFSADRAEAGDYKSDIGPILDTYFNPEGPGAILSIYQGDPDSLRRVKAYNEVDGVYVPRTFDNYLANAVGQGDIVSTLTDMHRWQRAVSNGTLISPEMFTLAVAPKTLNDGSQIERGYGFFHGEMDGELVILNTGDFFTHTRHFYMPSRDLSITLNTNGTPEYDGGQSSVVWVQIIGKVLNLQTFKIFGDEIDLNDL